MEPLELNDIQGLVRSGFKDYGEAVYQLLAIDDPAAAKGWLEALCNQRLITSAQDTIDFKYKVRGEDDTGCAAAIAFTCDGLRELGFPRDSLAMFVSEFQEGMVAEHRSRLLGDTGDNAPGGWDWGRPDQPTHMLLIVFAAEGTLARCLERFDGIAGKPRLLHQIHGRWTTQEPFGFADGLSQPRIEGLSSTAAQPGERSVKAGEFLLGYLNEFGQRPASPSVPLPADPETPLPPAPATGRADFGRNGTFLVMRQLRQHLDRFEQFIADAGAEGELLAARMVGRWKSGAPLVRHARNPHANFPESDHAFGFHHEDRAGLCCPIGAHIRRANPRDALADAAGVTPEEALAMVDQHRILRRGRVFEEAPVLPAFEEDPIPAGLVFICLNANIERQFEFIQNSWLMDPEFGGLHGETDPLIGTVAQGATRTMTIQGSSLGRRVDGLGQFVTVIGGAYFFLPGLRALRYLSRLPAPG